MWAFWTALGMAASMFTLLPLRHAKWVERLRPMALALLPLIGLGIGLLWWALAWLAGFLPPHLAGVLIAMAPWLLTGFIHLDGFLDASDALLSWRSREEKQRILHDVHVGAFAAVSLVLLALAQYAAAMDLQLRRGLIFVPVLSRCCSAWCALRLKPLGQSEYAGMAEGRTQARIPLAFAVAALLGLLLCGGLRGLVCGGVTLASYAVAMAVSLRALGGFSGDLAGFALTVSELCALIALAV